MTGVSIRVDFSGITDIIGNMEGIADGAESDAYLGGLIDAAHRVASLEFDVDAASVAYTGNMTHMYEFGTRGITRGQVKFPDPTAPEARLWVHNLVGSGRSREIGFIIREAFAPNPRPSATFYGVDNAVIRRLSRRKYTFRWKARVIEQGESVQIKPQEKPFNFVPFYGKPARNPKYSGRGYVFRPIEGRAPMESNPGEDSGATGTFTAFWERWWATRGQELMDGTASETFNKDVAFILTRYQGSLPSLESVVRYNSRGRVYNRRRKIKTRMIKLGAERGVNRIRRPR